MSLVSNVRFNQGPPNKMTLEHILGCRPFLSTSLNFGQIVKVENGSIKTTGVCIRISGRDHIYHVFPSNFKKEFSSSNLSTTPSYCIQGHGSIEGEWNKTGKKIATLFFASHKKNSIIYLNGVRHKLIKNKDNTVDLKRPFFRK